MKGVVRILDQVKMCKRSRMSYSLRKALILSTGATILGVASRGEIMMRACRIVV